MKEIKETFIPGEEWLYYKIYLGYKTSDMILVELMPILDQLCNEKIIEKWFFIRYYDPDYHLRIRIQLPKTDAISFILAKISHFLKPLVQNRLIYNVSLNTYNREIERYGECLIEDTETLFFYDSQMIVNAISSIKDKIGYTLFVIDSIQTFLNILHIENKLSFVEDNYRAFRKEFNADKHTIRQLSKKYQELLLINTKNITNHEKLIKDRDLKMNNTIKNIIPMLEKDYLDQKGYVSSIIHMSINRAFNKNQRLNEFLCYFFLFQELKTLKHKQK